MSVNDDELRRKRQGLDCQTHGTEPSVVDVHCVNQVGRGERSGPSGALALYLLAQALAVGGGQELGIGDVRNANIGAHYDCCGDHWAGQGTAAGLVNACHGLITGLRDVALVCGGGGWW